MAGATAGTVFGGRGGGLTTPNIHRGQRARTRRLALNLPSLELAARIGVSDKTLRNFEQTGLRTLDTFVHVLTANHARLAP